jgi:hypothetical protein
MRSLLKLMLRHAQHEDSLFGLVLSPSKGEAGPVKE